MYFKFSSRVSEENLRLYGGSFGKNLYGFFRKKNPQRYFRKKPLPGLPLENPCPDFPSKICSGFFLQKSLSQLFI
jgi:hypothetical protein